MKGLTPVLGATCVFERICSTGTKAVSLPARVQFSQLSETAKRRSELNKSTLVSNHFDEV